MLTAILVFYAVGVLLVTAVAVSRVLDHGVGDMVGCILGIAPFWPLWGLLSVIKQGMDE